MGLRFPSEEWAAAWVSACNLSPDLAQAAAGWTGAIALEIVGPATANAGPLILRLEGADGRWTGFQLGSTPTLTAGTAFSLRATSAVWRGVIRQEINPVRGIIQGRIRVRGQLSEVLQWSAALRLVTKLAGDLDTSFEDA